MRVFRNHDGATTSLTRGASVVITTNLSFSEWSAAMLPLKVYELVQHPVIRVNTASNKISN